jgi:hypothetical protein
MLHFNELKRIIPLLSTIQAKQARQSRVLIVVNKQAMKIPAETCKHGHSWDKFAHFQTNRVNGVAVIQRICIACRRLRTKAYSKKLVKAKLCKRGCGRPVMKDRRYCKDCAIKNAQDSQRNRLKKLKGR